jgi:hypothetical protein
MDLGSHGDNNPRQSSFFSSLMSSIVKTRRLNSPQLTDNRKRNATIGAPIANLCPKDARERRIGANMIGMNLHLASALERERNGAPWGIS